MSRKPKGPDAPRSVLLDTCAVIWLANGDPLAPAALEAITHAGLADGVLVSPATAWEVGLLSRPRASKASAVSFLPDPQSWFARFMAGAAIKEAPLIPDIAIASSLLPDPLHGDPADRFIIATARHHNVPVITRDGKILDYAEAGHVAAIGC